MEAAPDADGAKQRRGKAATWTATEPPTVQVAAWIRMACHVKEEQYGIELLGSWIWQNVWINVTLRLFIM